MLRRFCKIGSSSIGYPGKFARRVIVAPTIFRGYSLVQVVSIPDVACAVLCAFKMLYDNHEVRLQHHRLRAHPSQVSLH